jgi:hypothetical protein
MQRVECRTLYSSICRECKRKIKKLDAAQRNSTSNKRSIYQQKTANQIKNTSLSLSLFQIVTFSLTYPINPVIRKEPKNRIPTSATTAFVLFFDRHIRILSHSIVPPTYILHIILNPFYILIVSIFSIVIFSKIV